MAHCAELQRQRAAGLQDALLELARVGPHTALVVRSTDLDILGAGTRRQTRRGSLNAQHRKVPTAHGPASAIGGLLAVDPRGGGRATAIRRNARLRSAAVGRGVDTTIVGARVAGGVAAGERQGRGALGAAVHRYARGGTGAAVSPWPGPPLLLALPSAAGLLPPSSSPPLLPLETPPELPLLPELPPLPLPELVLEPPSLPLPGDAEVPPQWASASGAAERSGARNSQRICVLMNLSKSRLDRTLWLEPAQRASQRSILLAYS